MADLTLEVALSHVLAPHQTGASATHPPEDPKSIRKSKRALGGPGSGNFNHAGRPGEVGGSATSNARTFTSEEGYRWHETGPVAEWAKHTLTDDDRNAISGYAGFGFVSTNEVLRGKFPMKTEVVRPMTNEEINQHRDTVQMKGQTIKTDEGEMAFQHYDRPHFRVQREVVDEQRKEEALQAGRKLDAIIRERGYVLPEAIEVARYAYLPGVTEEQLEESRYQERLEAAFTSTMLGDANGRAKMGAAATKVENFYRRTGKVEGVENDKGTAVDFKIILPKGTKVLSVEAARRISGPGGRFDDLTPEGKTADTIAAYRSESEILLGSGARFLVRGVVPKANTSRYMNITTPTTLMVLEYIGGGSSDGRS